MSNILAYFQLGPPSGWTESIVLHTARIPFAIAILCLSAWLYPSLPENVLFFSIGLAIFTITVCIGSIIFRFAYPSIYNIKIDLATHVLMGVLWVVDLVLMCFLGWYRRADKEYLFKLWVAKLVMGTIEWALWLFEALVLARDLMKPSPDNEPMPLPPLPSASNFDWPTSPQQIDPWSPVSPLEPPRSGPQPLLPESVNQYDDDAQQLPDDFEFGFSQETSSDSSGQQVAELSPQQASSSTCSQGRRGAVSHLDPVGSRCVSPKKQPVRK
ncbi:hypothetical protein J4E93_001087 [Alternaria ventricosa]|uniref:uncharacterized protein n=1 Tax=Alternaria ventricosa TaxID=1187951 RepID=UPI0020C1CD66|nr:uncharacterized protein J4E93_001087 [Alternaria ventricosa]KAI4653325.1 hypothetical protein J4E93_001087 [Alternaria ventricosa]